MHESKNIIITSIYEYNDQFITRDIIIDFASRGLKGVFVVWRSREQAGGQPDIGCRHLPTVAELIGSETCQEISYWWFGSLMVDDTKRGTLYLYL